MREGDSATSSDVRVSGFGEHLVGENAIIICHRGDFCHLPPDSSSVRGESRHGADSRATDLGLDPRIVERRPSSEAATGDCRTERTDFETRKSASPTVKPASGRNRRAAHRNGPVPLANPTKSPGCGIESPGEYGIVHEN